MKTNISRQSVYLLSLSLLLLIFVLIFSFSVLIPKGKEYREQRLELNKVNRELRRHQDFHDNVLNKLKELQSNNRHIITAFDNEFNAERFHKQYRNHFNSFSISEKIDAQSDNDFAVYEVNTTSQINSPKSFYDFLEAINKSDWIIAINFPINFKRDSEVIRSTFTMKVYYNNKDLNTTKSIEPEELLK